MNKRLIRLSSNALGTPARVRVYIYDHLDQMIADAEAFSGDDNAGALGVTQAWTDDHGRAGLVIVRLWRGRLGTEIITHEMCHASLALYGATLPDRVSRTRHLNHFNEPLAYLHGQLCARLVKRLNDLGYYH